MKRIIVFFSVLVFALTAYSAKESVAIKDHSNYTDIINRHSDSFIYEFRGGYPLMPAYRQEITINNRAEIDSFSIIMSDPETLYIDAAPAQDPIPLSMNPRERSSIDIKGIYPDYDGDMSYGYTGRKTLVSLRANNYVYHGNFIIHFRTIDFNVFYTEQSDAGDIKASPSLLILTVDSLKSEWGAYQDIYPNVNVILASDDDLNTLYPAMDIKQAMRTYIQSLFADSALIAVMIASDTDVYPPIYIYMPFTTQLDSVSQVIITDRYYSNLDGNWDFDNDGIIGEIEDSVDLYPDILISRVPMRNSADIANFISKISTLRTSCGDTALFAASWLDANTNGAISMDNIIDILHIEDPVLKLYESSSNLSSYTFLAGINNSPFIVSHDGHGNSSSIQSGSDYTSMYNLDTLKNDIPVLFYSLSCWSAAFDNDCVAEHYLRAPNGGGFYVGNGRYGWYTPYFPGFGTGDLINIDFFDKLLNTTSNPAEALNLAVTDYAYEASRLNDYRWASFVLTYFGDPLINVNRGIHFPSVSYQTPYKNGLFSMAVSTGDSTFITCVSNAGTDYGVLYGGANLFNLATDNSDSLIIHLRSTEYNDTSFTVYQDNSGSKCYLKSYSIEYTGTDSMNLLLELSPYAAGTFTVYPVSKTDTFLFNGDSSYTLSGDTTLEMLVYAPSNTGLHTQLGLKIDDDTLFIQPGMNLRKSIEIDIKTEKAHYSAPDTIHADIAVSNISCDNFSSVMIIVKSDSLYFIDTLYTGSLNSEEVRNFSVNIPVISMTCEAADIEIIVSDVHLSYLKEYLVSTNNSNIYFDFESPTAFTVDSSTAFFHLSANRAASGSWSYFSGLAATASYPSNYRTLLYSEPFTYDTTQIFGFSTYYDTEAGFDYCLVILTSDTIDVPVATFSGNSGSWLDYSFNPDPYDFFIGRSVRLMFAFYSEDDAVLGEGWYLDNIVIPANESAAMIHEKPWTFAIENYPVNIRLLSNVTGSTLYFEMKNAQKLSYTIYDISGRMMKSGSISEKMPFINHQLTSGKYFISMPGFSSVFTVIR